MMKCVSSLRAPAINGKMFFLQVAAGAHVPKVAVYCCDCNDLPLVESGRRKMNFAVSRVHHIEPGERLSNEEKHTSLIPEVNNLI